MAESEENDKISLVAESEYIPELEAQVQYIMDTTPEYPRNEKRYKRAFMPHDLTDAEKYEWEVEQISRCKNGYDGMCGKQYFFFNFCWIQNLGGGRIAPEYRVCDNEWFSLIEECQFGKYRGWGVVCVKRRRVGASWKEAADVLHDCLFNPFFRVGMNSKTERDSIELFKKVKFMYSNLPPFLRAKVSSSTKMTMDFSYYMKDAKGNKIKRGLQSEILVVAPTDSAFEGQMLNKWIADEAGKTPNLDTMWSLTEDCLYQETRRLGVPILFGTSGDVGTVGRALVEMWDNAQVYRLKQFFFAGWNGLITDEFGNDRKEDSVRYIVYERHRRRNLSLEKQNDFIQRYPLTVEEAFRQATSGGLGDHIAINQQMRSLKKNPAAVSKGYMRWNENAPNGVEFVPSAKGLINIYEPPEKNISNLYVAGCDPADHDDAYEEASDLSTYIVKKHQGIEGPRIVAEFTDRPAKLDKYYEQALMLLLYYNKTRVLIERNRYRMIAYFEAAGYKNLLNTTPMGITRLFGGKTLAIGIHMNNDVKKYLEDLVTEYVDNYCELIPSYDLLQECMDYGIKNTDRVMAFGIALIQLKEDKRQLSVQEKAKLTTPNISYKMINGKLRLVHGK